AHLVALLDLAQARLGAVSGDDLRAFGDLHVLLAPRGRRDLQGALVLVDLLHGSGDVLARGCREAGWVRGRGLARRALLDRRLVGRRRALCSRSGEGNRDQSCECCANKKSLHVILLSTQEARERTRPRKYRRGAGGKRPIDVLVPGGTSLRRSGGR